MAAEAVGIGASVVAFIGITGQIAQGCQYIRTVLSDIHNAPSDLMALCAGVALFESNLLQFQKILQELDEVGIPVIHLSAIQDALDFSEKAVAGLIMSIAGNKDIGTRWGRIQFAFAKGKCAKYLDRVEKAKGFVSVAQAGLLLWVMLYSQSHNHYITNNIIGP
jgi:hypothetical protein